MLGINQFKNLVQIGSLFAIDLIAQNSNNEILLGLRKNRPAKDFYFVPGGRVYKTENLHQSLARISKDEIGIALTANDITPIGLYEHLYEENFFNEEGFTTHYIVLACKVLISINKTNLPVEQHSDYLFQTPEQLLSSDNVHKYTKNYFIPDPDNVFLNFNQFSL